MIIKEAGPANLVLKFSPAQHSAFFKMIRSDASNSLAVLQFFFHCVYLFSPIPGSSMNEKGNGWRLVDVRGPAILTATHESLASYQATVLANSLSCPYNTYRHVPQT